MLLGQTQYPSQPFNTRDSPNRTRWECATLVGFIVTCAGLSLAFLVVPEQYYNLEDDQSVVQQQFVWSSTCPGRLPSVLTYFTQYATRTDCGGCSVLEGPSQVSQCASTCETTQVMFPTNSTTATLSGKVPVAGGVATAAQLAAVRVRIQENAGSPLHGFVTKVVLLYNEERALMWSGHDPTPCGGEFVISNFTIISNRPLQDTLYFNRLEVTVQRPWLGEAGTFADQVSLSSISLESHQAQVTPSSACLVAVVGFITALPMATLIIGIQREARLPLPANDADTPATGGSEGMFWCRIIGLLLVAGGCIASAAWVVPGGISLREAQHYMSMHPRVAIIGCVGLALMLVFVGYAAQHLAVRSRRKRFKLRGSILIAKLATGVHSRNQALVLGGSMMLEATAVTVLFFSAVFRQIISLQAAPEWMNGLLTAVAVLWIVVRGRVVVTYCRARPSDIHSERRRLLDNVAAPHRAAPSSYQSLPSNSTAQHRASSSSSTSRQDSDGEAKAGALADMTPALMRPGGGSVSHGGDGLSWGGVTVDMGSVAFVADGSGSEGDDRWREDADDGFAGPVTSDDDDDSEGGSLAEPDTVPAKRVYAYDGSETKAPGDGAQRGVDGSRAAPAESPDNDLKGVGLSVTPANPAGNGDPTGAMPGQAAVGAGTGAGAGAASDEAEQVDEQEELLRDMRLVASRANLLVEAHTEATTAAELGTLETVPPDSKEFFRVSQALKWDMQSAEVVKVERILNEHVSWNYASQKGWLQRLARKAGLNERLGWHGTGKKPPEGIVTGRDGLDSRRGKIGLLGRAIYFATNAAYSDAKYAYERGPQKQMILALVLCGRPDVVDIPGKAERDLVAPRHGYDSTAMPSTLGSGDNKIATMVLAVYDSSHVYSVYVVTYTTG